MPKTPKISIIIPVYNQAKTIKKTLKSLFNQTFKDFEVIIVNDGSKDAILAVLRPFMTKIRLFNQENKGASVARNLGFSKSIGKYVIFCDADIVMKPNMLEEMASMLDKKKAFAYAYSSFRWDFKKFKLFPFDGKRLKEMPYIHTTSLIRREAFPGFDLSLKKFQDWDLFLTMLENGHKGVWIDKVLFKVKSGGTMSSWLPGFAYKLMPFLKEVKKYKEAKEIIKQKHSL